MVKNYYITTPIYYVNDKPHIGHAYTSLACDMIARFKRLDGYKVKFLTGTDEHGQKVAKSAEKQGLPPQEFTDKLSASFRGLITSLNFSPDDFIRTTETRHKDTAQVFWQKLKENGYIYKGKYEGWYSIRDEAFYTKDELIEGKAPTGSKVEWTKEESYFFKLSAFQDKLLKFYEDNPDFIAPLSRKHEVISFVRGGKNYQAGNLKDLSISRTSFNWGIPLKDDPNHVMYVWLDALTNYLSALNYAKKDQSDYQAFWPASVHIVGKDILRFHAVYWPAFLMAANLPLPQRIFAHGWWTNEGEKISKSLGNVIDPLQLSDQFGVDQLRYFLMKHINFGSDGNFSKDELIRHINSDLANNLGNLVQRVLAMIHKNCASSLPKKVTITSSEQTLLDQAYNLLPKLRILIDKQDLSTYLEEVINLSSIANEYINTQAPWRLKASDPERLATILYSLSETIKVIAIYLQPIMPTSANKILTSLGLKAHSTDFFQLNSKLSLGQKLPDLQIIFPKVIEC